MNKYLPNKTDDFFLKHLKNYGEEPAKNIWASIDKRLSDQQKIKPENSIIITLSKSAAVILLLLTPLLLIDALLPQKIISNETKSSSVFQQNKPAASTPNVFRQTLQNSGDKKLKARIDQALNALNNYSQNNYSIEKITPSNNLSSLVTYNKQQKLSEADPLIFLKNDSAKNNTTNNNKVASTIIKLHNKHSLYVVPFFSADHISGRFIEQYEFDNLSKNDYDKRESPDVSYTTGVLGAYNFYKRFSLMAGLSFSSSNISITTTAVIALADASGVYKFKLATSYGFAEIEKSGVTPNAGDTLLISSASMQFNYLSFPLLVSYDIGGKKIKYSIHGGVALNKLLSEKVEAEYEIQNKDEDETVNKIEGIRNAFFTLNTGVEAKYSLNKKIDISISPELRYGLNSINKNTPVKTFPVNYGVSLNACFKL